MSLAFFKRNETAMPPLDFTIGDWVTQYSTGYWKVVAIHDKYATENEEINGKLIRKGDKIGYWVILKKAFTAKMKWSNACECVDAYWCHPVSYEAQKAIENAFASETAKAKKFESATNVPRPGIQNCWISLPEEQIPQLKDELAMLPPCFTKEQLQDALNHISELEVGLPPSNLLLNLFVQPYMLDKNYDFIYCGYELDLS